jgi:uncharacterized protein (DUF2236 family)
MSTRQISVFNEAVVGVGLLAGVANVIMQLARPEVGYGVIESQVASGQFRRHPFKRSRTTISYLAVALLGDSADKRAYRKAVNRSHAQVRSTPSSPVSYNAFDRDLQLWIAACLYRGFEDTCRAFIGPLGPEERERLYQSGATMGTTLQMRAEDWPPDRDAFEKYWRAETEKLAIDEPVREYLMSLAEMRFLPWPIGLLFGGFSRFVTTGFLEPEFRDLMGLDWSEEEQRRFDQLTVVLRELTRLAPPPLRRFPYNALLWDLRLRQRFGLPLV